MPRIRWWRREGDREVTGIECVCGGDLLPTDTPGVYRCARCGGEWRAPQPAATDPVTGERAASDESAWSIWQDEQRYKRQVSKPGGHSSHSRRRRKLRPLTGRAKAIADAWRRLAETSRRARRQRRGLDT